MNLYYNVEEKEGLDEGQLVICCCPEWNDEGFQVARWNGEEFEYSGQPNDMFNELVISFAKMDKYGYVQ